VKQNEKQMPQHLGAQGQEKDALASPTLDILATVTKHRRFITRFVLAVTLGTTIVALLLPKWYKSTASVFPAEGTDLLGSLSGVASVARALAPSRALSALGTNPEADRYMAILKSATVFGSVIEKFDLVKVYDISSYPGENTMKELQSNTQFSVEEEGNITVTVYDRDPQRAADMANYFVEMLNRTNTELQVRNARENRRFIEERYDKNLSDLTAAEDSLKAFQQRYGVIAMPEQTEASIKAAAEIAGQLAFKEVESNVLRRTQSPESPAVMAARIEIEELRRKLDEMRSGAGSRDSRMKIWIPFNDVPELGGEYVRRYRDVEIQYEILKILTPLYEQAKVEERRSTPSVIVLDRAGPAERKAKPKVSLFALLAAVLSTIVALFVVFVLEMVERLRVSSPARFASIAATLRNDWFGLRFRRKGS